MRRIALDVAAAGKRTRQVRPPGWSGMVCGIVERAESLVPKHAFPLVGVCGITTHHKFEIVIMRLIAGEIV